jgi:iron only hydrogenase large subunit-like protein
MNASGYQDVDIVLTTRELGRMFKQSGLDMTNLPNEEYDAPLGISTGAGEIFGASGGVMEAALRTVYEVVTGTELENINFTACRGLTGVKEATVNVGDLPVSVAITNGLGSRASTTTRFWMPSRSSTPKRPSRRRAASTASSRDVPTSVP